MEAARTANERHAASWMVKHLERLASIHKAPALYLKGHNFSQIARNRKHRRVRKWKSRVRDRLLEHFNRHGPNIAKVVKATGANRKYAYQTRKLWQQQKAKTAEAVGVP